MPTTNPIPIDEIRQLLMDAVAEVFSTMFNLQPEPADPPRVADPGQMLVAGSVGFIGDVSGVVHLHVSASFARTLACRMLGMAEAEMEGDEMVNDVIGELSNMVVGAVKSHLCDNGMPCVLTIPSVVRGQRLTIEPIRSAERRLLSLRCGEDYFHLELSMKTAA
jgi:chemotaxis protein CheX